MANDAVDGDGISFLLVQLGAHLAGRFADALAPTGLEPRHVGLLRLLSEREGMSQQALGDLLGLNATRVVFLVDDMEQRGLVQRRRNPNDRRSHALHLTQPGKHALARARRLGEQQDAEVVASLPTADRKELLRVLRSLADHLGIAPHALPIPAHMRRDAARQSP
jgi:DNA-binding MarR family transcriptional regulator